LITNYTTLSQVTVAVEPELHMAFFEIIQISAVRRGPTEGYD